MFWKNQRAGLVLCSSQTLEMSNLQVCVQRVLLIGAFLSAAVTLTAVSVGTKSV